MIKSLFAAGFWLACLSAASAVTLQPVSIEQFCIAPNEPVTLQWRIESGSLGETTEAVIRDYTDRVVQSPAAKVSGAGLLVLPVKLGPGFYEIEIAATDQRFGLVSLPAFEGQRDPFFAIDSAMSWLVDNGATREGLVKVLARSGIPMSRERLNWSDINPKAGQWNWDGPRGYETLRQVCHREGVEVLEMFHGTTSWAGEVGKYPGDLVGTSAAWQQIARRYGPAWGAMEVWNEPDISFGDYLPADQYVPLVKAFAWSFQENQVAAPLVGGVFAHFNRQYLDNSARNGLLEQLPLVSFHTYGQAMQMEDLIGRYRQWLVEHKHPSKPLWLTECGRPWKRGPERPPAGQDGTSALDIVMKGVESKACGIDRYFPFVYPYYEERESNFGMMGREATPLRSMAGYAQLVAALSHKRYLGDLVCHDQKVLRARVFGNDRDAIAVLYTDKPDANATVRLDMPVAAVTGIDGRVLAAADGSVPIPDGLVYVRLSRQQLGKRLQTDTGAMQLFGLATGPAPKPAPASPVVLRYTVDRQLVEARSEGYRLLAESPGRMPLVFRVFNLSTKPETQTLTLSFSQPVVLETEAVQQATIPPQDSVEVRWNVDLAGALAATGTLRATLRAQGADARSGDMVEIDLSGDPTLEQVLQRYPVQVSLPIGNLTAWRDAISGSGKMTMESDADGLWRLKCRFQGGDRWVYPQLELADDIALDRFSAIVVRARCKEGASVRLFLWEGDTDVGYISPVVIPADGRWHTAVVGFDDFTPSGANRPDANHHLDRNLVRRISIGMNSESDENMLEVSTACLVAGGQGQGD